MCGLTFCAAHEQWPLHSLGHVCCGMMAPEKSVTESEDIRIRHELVHFQKASTFNAKMYLLNFYTKLIQTDIY